MSQINVSQTRHDIAVESTIITGSVVSETGLPPSIDTVVLPARVVNAIRHQLGELCTLLQRLSNFEQLFFLFARTHKLQTKRERPIARKRRRERDRRNASHVGGDGHDVVQVHADRVLLSLLVVNRERSGRSRRRQENIDATLAERTVEVLTNALPNDNPTLVVVRHRTSRQHEGSRQYAALQESVKRELDAIIGETHSALTGLT